MSREQLTISPPAFNVIAIPIRGTTPFVQNKMTQKARDAMRTSMVAAKAAKSRTARQPRDFDTDYQQTMRLMPDGRHGIHAAAFRKAMIRACDPVGLKMTRAKMAIFIEPDGIDADDGAPLVEIIGKPRRVEHLVTNSNGAPDIRVRPLWDVGWRATLRVRYDSDLLTADDVANLVNRAGSQVGIGAGRAFSANSAGMGWGHFEIVTDQPARKGGRK